MNSSEINLTLEDLKTPWFENFEKAKKVESIADRIQQSFANDYLVSCGNSFAWILKTLETKYSQKSKDVDYLPISSRFDMNFIDWEKFDLHHPTNGRVFKILEGTTEQRNNGIINLKKILELKKIDPESIITRYEKTGKKTILFDFAETGRSLASLLHVIMSFGLDENQKKSLNNALKLCSYCPVYSMGAESFLVNGQQFDNFSDKRITFSEDDREILVELANTDKNRLTAKNSILDYKMLESDFDLNTDIKKVTSQIKKAVETLVI